MVTDGTRGATRRQRAPDQRKILKVGKRSALRKARSVASFDARRNSMLATPKLSEGGSRDQLRRTCSRKQMLNSLLSLPAVVGEVFRSLDTTPLPFLATSA
jgi:hypothetical protein